MIPKKICKTLALSLTVVLTLTACNFSDIIDVDSELPEASETSITTSKPVQTAPLDIKGTDFSEIKYERYDDTDIQKLMEECSGKIDDAANADIVLDLFKQIEDEDYKLALSYEIAEIYNNKDATDQYYIDELEYSQKLLTSISDSVASLGKKILASPCGDAARSTWKEIDIKFYSEYIEMTDQQMKLREEEQSLVLDYNEASVKSYETTIGSEKYSLDDLYTSEDITDEEYQEGLQDIYKQMNDDMGPIYVELVKVRNEIAKSYGYDDYTQYAYEKVYKRDYSPEESLELCKEVKEYMVDAYYDIYSAYDYVAMSDLADKVSEMEIKDQMESVKSYLPQINTVLPESFDFMEKYNLYDLEYQDNKMATGFTLFLSVYNEPFLFNQPDGSFYDYMSLVHEFGHFNSYCVNVETAEQDSNLDLAEIHSQGLEMLYTNFYPEIFGDTAGQAAIDYTILMKLSTLTEGCLYDEFQQNVYAMDNPTLEDINKSFAKISLDYGYDYEEGDQGYEWVYIPHNFQSPLYYISYAVSVLPTFEIWQDSMVDFEKACTVYTNLVNCGEQEGYEKTITEAGLTSPFTDNYIENMANAITSYY